MKRFGAHVTISRGLLGALDKARGMGANCMQIFSSSPRGFIPPRFAGEECALFMKKAQELDIAPIFIHAKYIVTLASSKPLLRKLSIESLIQDLILAEKAGMSGVIVHTGSHKGKGFKEAVPLVRDAIQEILSQTPESSKIYLELASGGTGKIGSTWQELQTLRDVVGSPRVGVCLDTAHLFAGGIAFDTTKKVQVLSRVIETTVGWDELACIHVNDSKAAFGSFVDQHENLGEGMIGKDGLKLLLNSPQLNKLPLIIETPGFDDNGPDKKNLDILKSLVI